MRPWWELVRWPLCELLLSRLRSVTGQCLCMGMSKKPTVTSASTAALDCGALIPEVARVNPGWSIGRQVKLSLAVSAPAPWLWIQKSQNQLFVLKNDSVCPKHFRKSGDSFSRRLPDVIINDQQMVLIFPIPEQTREIKIWLAIVKPMGTWLLLMEQSR